MNLIKFSVLLVVFALFFGCSTKEHKILVSYKDAYKDIYSKNLDSILILPPLNLTTAADAGAYATHAISEPFLQKGYYVLPVNLTNAFFLTENLSDPSVIHQIPLSKLREVFGMKIVLYPIIHSWNTDYRVIASNVSVKMSFKAVEADTGNILWDRSATYSTTADGKIEGNSLTGLAISLLVNATAAALNSANDYFPMARNVATISSMNLPKSKYHPDFPSSWDEEYKLYNACRINDYGLYSNQICEQNKGWENGQPFYFVGSNKVFVSPAQKDEAGRYFYPIKSR